MSDANIASVSLDQLRELFQQAGYRVESVSDPVTNIVHLRSATGGLAFDIRPGSPIDGRAQDFVDVALVAVLQVQGELPLELVNRWNVTRRFGRLQFSPPFLVFSMDVGVFGGVSAAYFRAQIETWDRLVQELIGYLRDELRKLSVIQASAGQAAPAAVAPSQEPQHSIAANPSATIQ